MRNLQSLRWNHFSLLICTNSKAGQSSHKIDQLFIEIGILSLSISQHIRPRTNRRNRLFAIEQLALNDLAGSRHTNFQLFNGFTKLAATGCGEQDDSLASKVVTLQEGVDDSGGFIPPDRKP